MLVAVHIAGRGVGTGQGQGLQRGISRGQAQGCLPGPRPPRSAWSALHFLCRDVRALGITLMGHQKKILGSIQTMRAQLTSTQGPRRHL